MVGATVTEAVIDTNTMTIDTVTGLAAAMIEIQGIDAIRAIHVIHAIHLRVLVIPAMTLGTAVVLTLETLMIAMIMDTGTVHLRVQGHTAMDLKRLETLIHLATPHQLLLQANLLQRILQQATVMVCLRLILLKLYL